jgi:hypothetical protein
MRACKLSSSSRRIRGRRLPLAASFDGKWIRSAASQPSRPQARPATCSNLRPRPNLLTTTSPSPWATNRANAPASTRPSLTHHVVASLTAALVLLPRATVRAPLVVAARSLRASRLLDQRGTRQLRRLKLQHVSMPSSARRRLRSMSTSRQFVQYGLESSQKLSATAILTLRRPTLPALFRALQSPPPLRPIVVLSMSRSTSKTVTTSRTSRSMTCVIATP